MRIREFLAQQLSPSQSVTELTGFCTVLAAQPSKEVIRDLQNEITTRTITSEDYRRLQVLISQLYQLAGGVDLQLAKDLHVEVKRQYDLGRSGALLQMHSPDADSAHR